MQRHNLWYFSYKTKIMRIQAIKDSEASLKKKSAIAASLTAVVIILVLTYKKLQPKLLKYFKTKRHHHGIEKQILNGVTDFNEYIEMMVERQQSYEDQASLWI